MNPQEERIAIEDVQAGFHLLQPGDDDLFQSYAECVLDFQRRCNAVYKRYSGCRYLPIEAFKLAPVASFPPEEAELVFESSATGNHTSRSKHYVRRADVYHRSLLLHFKKAFGPGPFAILAHLPYYEELGERSSLVYMVRHLISEMGTTESGFYPSGAGDLQRAVDESEKKESRIVLIGAAFSLMDLVQSAPPDLPENATVIETGGMKTFRREIDRISLHEHLSRGFGLERSRIRSEYGMCELMSQCYTLGGEVFFPPPWMRFEVLDADHPDRVLADGEPGVLAVLDLANMYSVSAILTEDNAVRRGGGFEVIGRLSRAELRGCNFLLEQ